MHLSGINIITLPIAAIQIEPEINLAFNLAMLRLLLLRHAKATPHVAQDHTRALNGKGRANSTRMGTYLREESLIPDLVVASDSLRTKETAELVLKSADFDTPLRLEPRIYLAEASSLLKLLQQTDKSAKVLLAVGHNPGFSDLAQLLIGHGDRYAAARLREKFPSCALVVIDFDVESWRDIEPHSGRLDRFITPASLGGSDDGP
jgi:phosphohistidine phosphatase